MGKEETAGPKEKSSPKSTIGLAILIILLVFGGFFLWGYLSSERGQRSVQDAWATIKSVTIDPITDALAKARAAGAGGYFGTTSNQSSSKKGIDLASFTPISGELIPAGQAIDFRYKIEFANVQDAIQTSFFCQLENEKKKETRDGSIIPQSDVLLRKGTDVFCRIAKEDTADLDGAYTVFGWFTFPFTTKGATLPVYFISGNVADEVEAQGQEFFDAYDIGVKKSDLKVVYNGEPVSIGIGFGQDGDQPVIVRATDSLAYSTIGVTLTNEWKGTLVNLQDLRLRLPEGIRIDKEKSDSPSASCPFREAGQFRDTTEYVLDESFAQQIFPEYINKSKFFGEANQRTFSCWVNIDPSILADVPYIKKDVTADLTYTYQVEKKRSTISIKKQGESLVV